MSITLAPIGLQDRDRVAHLAPRPDQIRFSGTVAEAFASAQEGLDFYTILQGDLPVGFFKIDRSYAKVHGFAEAGDLGLRSVIVDAGHQGKGLGTAAMRALPGFLAPLYPQARRLWLTVNEKNPAAIASYCKAGFQNTGAVWPHGSEGPQYIMRVML